MSGWSRQHRARFRNPGDDVSILFARTPVPGRVKTRLQPPLTAAEACRLHEAATHDTAELLDQTMAGASKRIFWSHAPASNENSGKVQLPSSFFAEVQRGHDLGARMADAFTRAFSSGASRVVIFGSDSPHLPASRIPQAFAVLSDHDCVLGPAEDGGYYLIGCRRFDPRLFDSVAWSSPQTFEQTLANARRLNYTVAVLESWYDLDEWRDIERLAEEAKRGLVLSPHVAAFLEQLGLKSLH